MPNQQLVITLLSNDHPGVVTQLADVISHHGGNWQESRMTQLAGKFAGILKVSINAQRIDELTHSLRQLEDSNIHISVENAHDLKSTEFKTLAFELAGPDRQGIVSEISQAFADKGISIDDMETICSSMPWSGDPLFEATGVLLAPKNTDTKQLLEDLDAIEDKLGLDIKLSEQL